MISDEKNIEMIASPERKAMKIKLIHQGIVAEYKDSSNYSQLLSANDVVQGKSYLEGGNVLSTCNAQGVPSAIIGSESVLITKDKYLQSGENYTDEEIMSMIAKDLGVKPENITVIPQYDFHIDMCYRPLKNGQIAVPDYELALDFLRNEGLENQSSFTNEKLIQFLQTTADETREIRQQAIEKLKADGYEVVSLPCFAALNHTEFAKSNLQTNYMNAVCGTGADNSKFYITNKSDIPELDKMIEQYLHDIGIDDVYFVSSTNYLRQMGGIDCLTKEIAQ